MWDEGGHVCEAKAGYHIPPEIVQQVLDATEPADLDNKLRNKLYVAMGRSMEKPGVPGAVLARWAEDRKHNADKFHFLKEWAKDPSFGKMTLTETHYRKAVDYKETDYEWVTKYDLYSSKNAYAHQDQMDYCNEILSQARKKPHPSHKKNEKTVGGPQSIAPVLNRTTLLRRVTTDTHTWFTKINCSQHTIISIERKLMKNN